LSGIYIPGVADGGNTTPVAYTGDHTAITNAPEGAFCIDWQNQSLWSWHNGAWVQIAGGSGGPFVGNGIVAGATTTGDLYVSGDNPSVTNPLVNSIWIDWSDQNIQVFVDNQWIPVCVYIDPKNLVYTDNFAPKEQCKYIFFSDHTIGHTQDALCIDLNADGGTLYAQSGPAANWTQIGGQPVKNFVAGTPTATGTLEISVGGVVYQLLCTPK
jgi:hypothetical protein